MKLSEQRCKPIQAGTAPLSRKEAEDLLRQIPSWSLYEKEITRQFLFGTFREAVTFVNSVASIADEQDHHPDIGIAYNKVQLTFTTHKIGGLSLNDFIVAARIDGLEAERATAYA